MSRPPWEYPGLPDGLSGQAFRDAALALRSGEHAGRVQSLPVGLRYRSSALAGTDYPETARRIRDAARHDSLAGIRAHIGDEPGRVVLPAILWPDPSERDGDVVPLAVIAPNGYIGSVRNQTGTVLAQWVAAHAERGWLWAAPAQVPLIGVHAQLWHPTLTALRARG